MRPEHICDPSDHRPMYRAPFRWTRDGETWTAATNGACLVAARGDHAADDAPTFDPSDAIGLGWLIGGTVTHAQIRGWLDQAAPVVDGRAQVGLVLGVPLDLRLLARVADAVELPDDAPVEVAVSDRLGGEAVRFSGDGWLAVVLGVRLHDPANVLEVAP